MARQIINSGTLKLGDPLRTAFNKINDNFTELYTEFTSSSSDRLVNGSNELILDASGNLILPAGGDILDSNGNSVLRLNLDGGGAATVFSINDLGIDGGMASSIFDQIIEGNGA